MATHVSTSLFSWSIFDDLMALDEAAKFNLMSKFWPHLLSIQAFNADDYSLFIAYIGREVKKLRSHQSKFAAGTLDSTLELIDLIRTSSSLTKDAVLRNSSNRFQGVDDRAILRSLELASRLWLTINIQSDTVTLGAIQANLGTVEWATTASLDETVVKTFSMLSSQRLTARGTTSKTNFSPDFTAASLVSRNIVRLAWTDNLADHLNFDKRRRVLTVYEHKICLLNHSKDPKPPIAPDILNEALDTMNLLFPFGHIPTRELLRREGKLPLYQLGYCDRPNLVPLDEYRVWRDQLAELMEVFDGQPTNISQMLRDRRYFRDLFDTLVQLQVLLLSLIALILGTLSVYYSFKQYKLAGYQYELSRKQACTSPDATRLLPSFCP